jgi:hypothetical protein
MPHFGFEAYGEGFFGKLLHGRGFLPEGVQRWVRPNFRTLAGFPGRRLRTAAWPIGRRRRQALPRHADHPEYSVDGAKEP